MKRVALIVTADDFGIGPATSRGIIRAHLEGPVTSTSVMVVTGDRSAASASLLAQAPRLEVGLHIVLSGSGEKPLCVGRHSGLAGRDGQLQSLPRLLVDALRGRVSGAAVRDEIAAQAERFVTLIGRAPAYVDGHHHAHQLPVVRDALIDLMNHGMLPRVTRTTAVLPGTARTRPSTLLRQAVAQSLGTAAKRAFAGAAVFSNDWFFGMLEKDDWVDPFPWRADLRRLGGLPPGRVVEWVVHPGLPDDSWAGRDPYVEGRPMELRALTDPACRPTWERWQASLTTKMSVLEDEAFTLCEEAPSRKREKRAIE